MAVLGTRIPVHQIIAIIAVTALTAMALVWSAASGPAAAQPETVVGRASAYLSRNAGAMGLRADLADLQVYDSRESLTADHIRYQQTLNGVPVFGATLTVNLPKDGKAQATTLNRYISGAKAAAIVAPVAPESAVANAAASVGAPDAREMAPAELVYYQTPDKKLTLAWKLTLRTLDPFGDWLVIADAATGRQLLRLSLLSYDQGRVFDPNPAVTNGGTPPAPDCDGPVQQAVLSSQYRMQTLEGIDPGQGQLKGQFADLTAPGVTDALNPAGVADEPTHNYIYGCNDPRFEEVMVYYHLDKTQRKIQSLGFTGSTGIIDRPISAHAHFLSPSFNGCNAFYSGNDRALHFGDFDGCGVGVPSADSAEDADVIIHEYGHAIQDDEVPGFGLVLPPFLEQTGAIGEGFGDFNAAVNNGDPCIGEYVNFGLFECGGSPGLRYDVNTMDYPTGYRSSCPTVDLTGDGIPESIEVHCGGLLWGGALWDLTENLSGGAGAVTDAGRDLAYKLVLESQFFLDQQVQFDEAAAAICFADSLLFGGAHQATIGSTFASRGISSGACFPTDFPALYMRIRHPSSFELDVNFLVGPDVNSPLCEVNVGDPNPNPLLINIPDVYVFGGELDPSSCSEFLPPSPAQPWWLEVKDTLPGNVGTITEFQILLPGGERCVATDTPVEIPDNGPFAYSKVDCTTRLGPDAGTPGPGTPTPTPTQTPPPGSGQVGDVDCANGVNSVDALKVLRNVASLSVSQTEPCPDIGQGLLGIPQGIAPLQGDVDCSGSVNSVDALKILRFVAGLSVSQNEPCADIGTGGGPTPTPTPEPGTPTPTFNPNLTDCQTFTSGAPIPDNSTSGIVGTLNVPDSGTLQDIDVCVNVNHPRPSDIRLRLRHVTTSTEVLIFNGAACAMPNIRLYFNDESPHGTICPLDGDVRPNQALSAFNGQNVHGTWQLEFTDEVAGQTGQ
ncbi:MAG TPA: M36 family metallopeptidase, partial [Dehalococcoidia bacterium]|nr:M36 family metallopeptidase [Dehalococcoidia bacterium]